MSDEDDLLQDDNDIQYLYNKKNIIDEAEDSDEADSDAESDANADYAEHQNANGKFLLLFLVKI